MSTDKSLEIIDWDYWIKMQHVRLDEAVFLSCGKDPGDALRFDGSIPLLCGARILLDSMAKNASKTEEQKRFDYALAALGRDGGIPVKSKNHSSVESAVIDIREFGSWAKSKELDLPGKFPTTEDLSPHKRMDGYQLSLPYECPFISKLVDIMWEAYGDIENRKSPKQETVQSEIVARIGINERIAVTIAGQIKPEIK